MSSDHLENFPTNSSRSSRVQNNTSHVHIRIEDNDVTPALPDNHNQSIPFLMANDSRSPSSSLHTIYSRVRQLSFSRTPSSLRTLISHSRGFRYTPLSTDSSHVNNNSHIHGNEASIELTSNANNFENLENPNNLQSENNAHGYIPQDMHRSQVLNPDIDTNNSNVVEEPPPAAVHLEDDNNNNVFSDILVRVLGNFVRYLPFLAILFVKFIHDHLIGILDIASIQLIIWFINKSLTNQVSKFSQKNMFVILRDFILVSLTMGYRVLLSSSLPDPFGLIIRPPTETLNIEVSTTTTTSQTIDASNRAQSPSLTLLKQYINFPDTRGAINTSAENTIHVTRAISLGLLVYYIAVNDLVLKLLTMWTKLLITMLPSKCLRHKQRARLYVLIEYFSQFYRSLVPIRQWILFLFKSYTGLEVISGILFCAFYLGAKGFEFVSRGKVLQKVFMNFIHNTDYERKPTKEEMKAAGELCPICHDSYNTPIVLSCNHIFCDDCVSQWFKREQTCPMCRSKVCEDPKWQDGATTFFYQFC